MSVKLIDTATRFSLTLDAKRAKLVVQELAHEKKVRRHGKGMRLTTDACCIIVVTLPSGKKRRYQIFDKIVVLEESTNLSWQFFAGMLLMDWLRQAQPSRPPRPFQPAVP